MIGGVLGALTGALAASQGGGGANAELLGGATGALAGVLAGRAVCGASPGVLPPSASIHARPRDGEAPLTVQVEAELSPGSARIARVEWDLGDGSRAEGMSATHTYTRPGRYALTLRATDELGQRASASAELVVREPARRPARPLEEPEGEAQRNPPAPARRIILRGVHFEFDSAGISLAEALVLRTAAEQLQGEPALRVRVVGHTDSAGSARYNRALSARRARAVQRFLIRRGVARGRLRSEGRGESQPIAGNATRDGRAQNRRVELEVLE